MCILKKENRVSGHFLSYFSTSFPPSIPPNKAYCPNSGFDETKMSFHLHKTRGIFWNVPGSPFVQNKYILRKYFKKVYNYLYVVIYLSLIKDNKYSQN